MEDVLDGMQDVKGKVLYIEDQDINQVLMEAQLSDLPGITLIQATTGAEGVRLVRSEHPDLVLLDMHLPDIDGLELLRHLKSDPSTADIPVVAVSADALASQIEAAIQAGAQQYLTKPISVSELLAVVDAVLEGAETKFG